MTGFAVRSGTLSKSFPVQLLNWICWAYEQRSYYLLRFQMHYFQYLKKASERR